jgi:rhomboid family GlyGly-CTERM serine protease
MSRLLLGSVGCPLAITLLCLALKPLPEAWQLAFQYQHSAILDGELWRLFTGHLTHLSGAHLWMNLVGLWLIWLLFFLHESARSLCLYRLPALLIGTSLALLLLSPEVNWYRGLSGVLHGLLALALLRHCQSQPLAGGLLLALFSVKIAWEQISGPVPGSEAWIAGRVIVDSHLYGAIWGSLIWLLERSHHHFKNREVIG